MKLAQISLVLYGDHLRCMEIDPMNNSAIPNTKVGDLSYSEQADTKASEPSKDAQAGAHQLERWIDHNWPIADIESVIAANS